MALTACLECSLDPFHVELSPEVLAVTEIPGGWEKRGGGGGGELYLTPHCHHQKYLCFKMGSDESRFNVSFVVMGNVHKTESMNHNLKRKNIRSGESSLSDYQ